MRSSTSSPKQRALCAAGFIAAASSAVFLSMSPYTADAIRKTAAFSAGLFYSSDVKLTNNVNEAADTAEKKHSYSIDDSHMISYGAPFMPSSENEEPALPELTEYSGEEGTVKEVFYDKYSGNDYITLSSGAQVRNLTHYGSSELYELSEQLPDINILADGTPEVLIMHTHTTECYYDPDNNNSGTGFRTTDRHRNMNAVGDKIASELISAGIGVIHDTEIYDYPSYNGSYDRSREGVLSVLRDNPGIKIVLDIHRDAIERDDTRIAPVTMIDGRKAAQIMIICGCDDGTMDMPRHLDNFRFACFLQNGFERDFPTLTRPMLFDYRHYNQDITTGSLLIEVGGHANTLEEAEYSGELIGRSLAESLKNLNQ